MKTPDLSHYAPPGANIAQEIKNLCAGLIGAGFCAILSFGINFRAAYDSLFERFGVDYRLRADALMMPFDAVLNHALWLFYVVALCSLASAILHHISYYTGGSKSIYLMRRLPQRWERLKRDITLPLVGAALSLMAALLLRLLFLGIYYLITPAQCLL